MLNKSAAALAVLLLGFPALAQETPQNAPLTTELSTQGTGPALAFTLGLGVEASPSYFGSDSVDIGPDVSVSLDAIRLGGLTFGDPDPFALPTGISFGGSFRFIEERTASDDPELAGLADVDASLELGASLRFGTPDYAVFGAVRYGVVGHESLVGELGADVYSRPSDRLTLRAGPRLLFGSDDYAATYFGVTAAEAAASAFPAFTAEGGLVSAGVELGLDYRFNEDWGLDATLRAERLTGDAGDSPIVIDREQVTATIGLTRRFSFGF